MVWLPVLNYQDAATLQRNAHLYEKLIPSNPRVLHYSDPNGYAGKAFSSVVGVPYGAPAWDVYLAFGASAEWGETVPAPAHWEHQLGGLPPEKRLEGERFANEVRRLLAAAEK